MNTGFLTPLDTVIFFGSLLVVMIVGLWAGRKEETSEDYFLAGKGTRWWGVAGSIFGSNVSANHIVGMMAVGFSVGFAQSHFEITAIAGLLLLCYGFLPMYRRLNVYTLSEYLSSRYNDASRVSYALIMIVIMVVIQMVPGFYIGSRSLNLLFQEGQVATAQAIVSEEGVVTAVQLERTGVGYAGVPKIEIAPPGEGADESQIAQAQATVAEGEVTAIEVTQGGAGYDAASPPIVAVTGGAAFDATLNPDKVNPDWYMWGIIIMAVVTGTYTIIGGLKAVIITDVIQSVLLLGAGLLVAWFTFSQPEIGGWFNMAAMDAGPDGADRLHLYNPTDDPSLPWTGVLSGLMVLHFYYWGANQFIVQRALSARSDREAKLGIIAAGFFKLLIPFFSIGTGIAAFYLFHQRGMADVAQDEVFTVLLKELIAPIGFGLVGLVAAGMIGAILSSLDSMMNSAATIVTFDLYQRYVNPDASHRALIWVGRLCIVVFITGAALLTILTMDPNTTESFFLHIASHQGRLIAGVVVAFGLGMLWKRASATGAFVAIVAGVALSYGLGPLYQWFVNQYRSINDAGEVTFAGFGGDVVAMFGPELNFLHVVFVAAAISFVLHVVISLLIKPDEEKAKNTWTGLGGIAPATLGRIFVIFLMLVLVYVLLAILMIYSDVLTPFGAAWVAAIATAVVFWAEGVNHVRQLAQSGEEEVTFTTWLIEDRFWAGLPAGCAVFMMYCFY